MFYALRKKKKFLKIEDVYKMKSYAFGLSCRMTSGIREVMVFGQISQHDECFYMAVPSTAVPEGQPWPRLHADFANQFGPM